MQLTKTKQTFDLKKVVQILTTENKFITDLFSILCLPPRNVTEENEDQNESNVQQNNFNRKDTTRAKSLTELQERLQAITSKKKLTYKDKLVKKNLKNRMKKKSKQDDRNAQQKLLRTQKAMQLDNKIQIDNVNGCVKTAKPVFNSEDLGVKKDRKQEKDPKKILKNLEKEQGKLNMLKESGEIGKVIELTEKIAWKNALAKAQGEKVKDDPILLKKTVQRHEQKKRSSEKKWRAHQENVTKSQQERQNKRTENIEKRKREKKKSKLKKAVKKGKIIPGF
ncbi:SURF6 domain containing protein [Asbolus verrucosus]|uniref:SURF6 domain containing protein n=1 Tax=Asbolus verrucosus TaxID=1661398 RepID=A0A482W4T5_ASBVE|nr:SURF6 domain containing protein [Asbolus verrucosus]